MTPRTELRATYRLQLHAGFPFVAAEAIVPYLADLGVSHLYLSPIWAARPGSTHGYDVVDHARISPELGGREGFDALADRARAHGLGIILDCVPNHMGIGYDNPWWADMLRWGEASPYAAYFDVEWDALEPSLAGKVLLPVLGDHYGRCLDDGQLVPDIEGGRMVVRYHEHTVPIHPRDTAELLETAGRNTDAAVAATLNDLASLARQIARRRERVSRQRRRADRDRADQLDLQLATARQVPTVEAALRDALATFTPTRDDHRPADRLHRLLERQAYRLSYWRLAGEEINYRRFFDVNGLAGLRMEEPGLFDAVHRLVVELTAAGVVDGLRLDHIDGLYDPRTYLTRLRRATRRGDGTAPWLFVEKILGEHEELRRDWPVDGTTGYEVMALLHGVQVDPAACRPLLALYRSLTQPSAEFHAETVRAKYLMMSTALQAELNVLAMELNRIAKRSRRTRDFGRHALREALRNVVAHFPVYRTYFSGKRSAAADLAVIDDAIARARQAAGTPEIEIYDFVRDALRGEAGGAWSAVSAHLAGRFQQYTGPVTAKAVEDTTFYRWVPLASLNEVGSEPMRFGIDVHVFHEANRARRAAWPRALVATATHDHKRGEDVRARLAVLTEMPRLWGTSVKRWFRLSQALTTATDGGPAPSANDRYLFFQMLVGMWPIGLRTADREGLDALRQRLAAYMTKAMREAKVRTSWAFVDDVYEAAVQDFVDAAVDPDQSPRLLAEIQTLVDAITPAGAVNGLAQAVLKLTVPGIPDVYQGTEGWDFSAVDPDNRRPVDYTLRRETLGTWLASDVSLEELAATWGDGRIKQAVVAALLQARRDDPELFVQGDYEPLAAEGEAASNVVAFARRRSGRALVVAVPRLVSGRLVDAAGLSVDWGDTVVPRLKLSARTPKAFDVLRRRPVELGDRWRLDELAAELPLVVLRVER